MDIAKIKDEFSKIKGKKIEHDGERVYIEDLYVKDENATVLLSNDKEIDIFEAINLVDESMATNNGSPSQSDIEKFSSSAESMPFFEGIEYDEHGIPKLNNIVSHEEYEQVAEHSNNFRAQQRSSTNPVISLIENAKKKNTTISLEFNVDLISDALYDVLIESYDENEINEALVNNLRKQMEEIWSDSIKKAILKKFGKDVTEADKTTEVNNTI